MFIVLFLQIGPPLKLGILLLYLEADVNSRVPHWEDTKELVTLWQQLTKGILTHVQRPNCI